MSSDDGCDDRNDDEEDDDNGDDEAVDAADDDVHDKEDALHRVEPMARGSTRQLARRVHLHFHHLHEQCYPRHHHNQHHHHIAKHIHCYLK